ncbi:cytochrome b ascorbate-dependent protein 3 [Apteryx rowi]|uniref:cytochrome b ascorbate-dependent protein 3 n=1 Tax=Apteryx rowi TaxID=308060 RepID=UPI000E1D41C5|nr:cytochrome b ascorbate-dependent protein 3 [Apteryx rowi]
MTEHCRGHVAVCHSACIPCRTALGPGHRPPAWSAVGLAAAPSSQPPFWERRSSGQFPFQAGSSPAGACRQESAGVGAQPRQRLSGRLALPRRRPSGAGMLELPFLPFCALLGGLGVACVAFVSAWCQQWRGGFAWDGSARMFNWHPVLMVTGLVVLYGAAALVYRLPVSWRGPKLPWKVLHGALALAAFCLAVLGLVAVFSFHDARGTPNMYSLHSWLGLATVLLFSCQWLAGFASFLLPWAPAWLRALYAPAAGCSLPAGAPGGGRVFSTGRGTDGHREAPEQRYRPSGQRGRSRHGTRSRHVAAEGGVWQGWAAPGEVSVALLFQRKNGTTAYARLPPEAVFANTLGLLILLFGVLVLWALARPDWKRPEADSVDTRQPLLSAER